MYYAKASIWMTTQRAEQVDREAKGVMIAATKTLIKHQVDNVWAVPASETEKFYDVNLDNNTCTCPDHRNRLLKCKHIFAAEYTAKRVATQGTPCPHCNGTGFVP
jgi:hypothetical protein